MTIKYKTLKNSAIFLLVALLLIELITTILHKSGSSEIKDSLIFFSIKGVPLIIVLASIILEKSHKVAIFIGWICLAIGTSTLIFYFAYDGRGMDVLGLLLKIPIYWLCSIFSLISLLGTISERLKS